MERKFFQKPSIYVGEVSVNVTNLERSLHFYKDFMGFRVLQQTQRKATLTADGKTALLTLEQPENVVPKSGRTTGLYHFAVLLPERKELAKFLKHLIQTKGHQIRLGASDHYVSEALYFDDPDGNGIEVARDRPSFEWTWQGGKVEMATVALDAEDLLSEIDEEWTGMPEETLIGHIHLHVADLESTERFYVNGLGFNIVTKYPGALFASTNGYHHHLGLNVWNGAGAPQPEENSVGLNWFTLVFPDEERRSQTADHLHRMGIRVKKENGDYVTEDPSGNRIRLRVN